MQELPISPDSRNSNDRTADLNVSLSDLSLSGDLSSPIVNAERSAIEGMAALPPARGRGDKGKNPDGEQNTERRPRVPTPTLDREGIDLNKRAADGRHDPVLNRDKEVEAVIQTLIRRGKNNPVLIGEPGVGKTAVVEELAWRIENGLVPELEGKRIVTLEMGGLLAGTKYRGSFEEKVKNIVAEVKKAGDVILFIDEIHTVISSGSSEGGLNIGNMIKPELARRGLQVIGATTIDEYRKHIEKDGALERRFRPILIEEPDKESTRGILEGIKSLYEKHHEVTFTQEALEGAVKYSNRYLGDRRQPDKSIDLLDEAASRLKLEHYKNPAISLVVTERQIAEVISSITGIPIGSLSMKRGKEVLDLADKMRERIKGQDEVVEALAQAEMREASGMKDPRRPYVCYFMGPTGTGKTYSAQVFSELTGRSLVRFDMSEFMESHTVSKLIGAPPGYVGYEEPGQLTEEVRRHPNAVVLFDEFDKAHPEIQKIMLQMMDDGRVTDSKGRVINCSNLVIIMTSNVGAQEQEKKAQGGGLGFGFTLSASEQPKEDVEKARTSLQKVLKEAGYPPEFLNRIDGIAQFLPLTHEHKAGIAQVAFKEIADLAKQNCGITLTADDAAIQFLADKGFDPRYGARSLRRATLALIADPLADALLIGTIKSGDTVLVEVSQDKKALTFKAAN